MTAQDWSSLMSIASRASEEEKRRLLLDGIYRIVENWQGPLPDLLEIFRPEKIERLLSYAVTDREGDEKARIRFIKFVVDTGYRDQPKIGTDGRYALHRTTPIHLVSRAQVRDSPGIVHSLFEIYDRFDLNYIDETGFTHLHAAGSIPDGQRLVARFLEHGQNPNVVLIPGHSLLRSAVQNDWQLAAELLKRGASPTWRDADGSTALHAICRDGRVNHLLQLFFEIVDEHREPVQVDVRDSFGNTPLHLAMLHGNKRATEILLARGAEPNLANKKGWTPLHLIYRRVEKDESIESFFKVNEENRQTVQVDVRDRKGNTPLHLTLENSNAWASEILLTRGADVNSVNEKGSTPLHIMCQKTEADLLVKNFFAINARLNNPVRVNVRDSFGNTPLHLAMLHGHKKATESLLRAGADPNLANDKGETPLHVICRRADGCDIVEVFFKVVRELRGKPQVQVDARDCYGNTALHLAVRHRSTMKFSILLVNGADPNLADNVGCTALHLVCHSLRPYGSMSRFFEIVDQMQRQVRLDAQDNAGWTPLHVAVHSRCKGKFQTLLERGADPNVANRDGQTALHFLGSRIHDDFMWRFFGIVGDTRRPVLIDARDTRGRTPLLVALFAKNTRAAKRLLSVGANPNLADADGWTPLHVICIECNWFLDAFFRINAERQQPVEIDAKTNEGRTPLNLLRNRKPFNYEQVSRYLEQLGAELD
ncbi:ankyrin-1-like [Trichogramma pretiosum]|uniref:ankyrin-1-like n=1 Tax=Trichogramma pretiosum TaxID=7493 RepID=UPI0006C94E05|nr:ankyrin-1-like [Trichogramma pretiosum]